MVRIKTLTGQIIIIIITFITFSHWMASFVELADVSPEKDADNKVAAAADKQDFFGFPSFSFSLLQMLFF